MSRQSEMLLSAHVNGIEGGAKAYRDTEALEIADVDERGAIVVAGFDQAAAVDVGGIVVFADGNTSGPASGIGGFERGTNRAITRKANCGW